MSATAVTRRAVLVAGAALTGLTVAGCSEQRPTAAHSAGDALVMIIRHAEKPADGGPGGILPSGSPDASSLTVAGWTRAGALVELFDPRTERGPGPVRPGLARPATVIAADPAGASRRPFQTVTPLADRLGVPVSSELAKGQEADLASRLRTATRPTLVAWEHESIPAIVSHLGTVDPAPPETWPSDRFDLIWCFLRRPGAPWTFRQLPQTLLAGDRSAPG